jgi:O-antigen biosynthesis protein
MKNWHLLLVLLLWHSSEATRQPSVETHAYSLTKIFQEHSGLIVDKWEQYVDAYEDILAPYRRSNHIAGVATAITERSTSILEIGVSFGGSLQVWKKFFGPSSTVVGVDINTNVCDYNYHLTHGDIFTFCFDASSRAHLDIFFATEWIHGSDRTMFLIPQDDGLEHAPSGGAPLQYDIIIDDGSHINHDVISTFNASFEHVAAGGVYVVEDVMWYVAVSPTPLWRFSHVQYV